MTSSPFDDIEKLEARLWEAADNLRANSKLTSSEYAMPVLGIIFLRHRSGSGRRQDAQTAFEEKRLCASPGHDAAATGPIRFPVEPDLG